MPALVAELDALLQVRKFHTVLKLLETKKDSVGTGLHVHPDVSMPSLGSWMSLLEVCQQSVSVKTLVQQIRSISIGGRPLSCSCCQAIRTAVDASNCCRGRPYPMCDRFQAVT